MRHKELNKVECPDYLSTLSTWKRQSGDISVICFVMPIVTSTSSNLNAAISWQMFCVHCLNTSSSTRPTGAAMHAGYSKIAERCCIALLLVTTTRIGANFQTDVGLGRSTGTTQTNFKQTPDTPLLEELSGSLVSMPWTPRGVLKPIHYAQRLEISPKRNSQSRDHFCTFNWLMIISITSLCLLTLMLNYSGMIR